VDADLGTPTGCQHYGSQALPLVKGRIVGGRRSMRTYSQRSPRSAAARSPSRPSTSLHSVAARPVNRHPHRPTTRNPLTPFCYRSSVKSHGAFRSSSSVWAAAVVEERTSWAATASGAVDLNSLQEPWMRTRTFVVPLITENAPSTGPRSDLP
jgi:hypothetical protein